MWTEQFFGILTNGRNRLPSPDLLTLRDFDLKQVRVQRANFTPLTILVELMFDDDDVAPQSSAVFRKNHAPVCDGVNVLTQVRRSAAAAIPIFASMNTK